MRLISIHLLNFRLHADTQITFPDGVIGILGSNEGGKTTILEGIEWALSGGGVTRGTKEGLRWNRAPARKVASVELIFEVGGTVYRIVRTENGAKLYDHTKGTVIADGTAPTNKFIPGLLGMGPVEFRSSFLCRQKDVSRISAMLPTDRLAFIRKVMGHDAIDRALKACRKKKSALSAELTGAEAGLGLRAPLEENLNRANREWIGAKKNLEVVGGLNADATVDDIRAGEVLAASVTIRDHHTAINRELGAAEVSRTQAENEIVRLNAKIGHQNEATPKVAEADERLKDLPDHRKARDELLEDRRLREKKNELVERIENVDREIEELQAEIDSHEETILDFGPEAWAEANRSAGEADQFLQGLTSARRVERGKLLSEAGFQDARKDDFERKVFLIQSEGVDGRCPTCCRVLEDTFSAVVDELSSIGNEAHVEALRLRTEAEALIDPTDEEIDAEIIRDETEKEVERLQDLKNKAQVAMDTRQKDLDRMVSAKHFRSQLQAQAAEIGDTTSEHITLARVTGLVVDLEMLQSSKELAAWRALIAQVDETKDQHEIQTGLLETATANAKDAEASIASLAFDPERHEVVRAKADTARQSAVDAKIALATAEEAERGAGRQSVAASGALDAYDSRAVHVEDMKEAHLLHERTAARLADFRVAIAATIRPEMEELMSGFVHLLTDGRHEAVELSEDFAATLYESGVPVEVVSGGTEDIAALAMRLALSQMIAERAGHPLSLLILDEPFGSLDETRRANVLTLIRKLGGVFKQVIVISHVAETRDAVDHAIELEFDEAAGAARVVA